MKAYTWAILATIVWGVAPVLEKIGLLNTKPLAGVFLRSIAVFAAALVILLFSPGCLKEIAGLDARSVVFICLGGVLASIVGSIFFYNALKLGEASRIVPIAASFPLISFVLGVIILKEGITVSKLFGMGLILAGIYLLR